jgi:hypothetical protein
VESKIGHLEQQFRRAYNFANNKTGAGLMSKNNGSFKEAVKKYCKYYFDLEENMGDHSSTGPKATSEHNLANDLDSDDDSEVDKIHLMMNRRKKDTDSDNYDNEDDASSSKAGNGDKLYETPTVTTKRQEKTKITTTITKATKKKKIEIQPKTDDSVALYMVEQQELVKAKLEKEKLSLVSYTALERSKLLQMCEELVHSHPTWS